MTNPGGWQKEQRKVDRVFAPLGESVDIYETRKVDGTVFYRIGIKDKKGWTTRYIITGK